MSAGENAKPAADGVPSSPGRRLASARTAQNMSQADVARQLKLSVWQVEALEAGRYAQLPGPIFVRGFIRNYARLVKLDPEELVQALGDSVPQAARRTETPPSKDIPFPAGGRPRWVALAVPALFLVALLAIYEFLWNEPDAEPAAPAAAASAPKSAAAGPQPGATAAAPKPIATATDEAKSSPTSVATASGVTQAREAPADAEPAPAPETERPARRGEKKVKLAFDQECWVEIRDRNEKVIFSQLNRAGTQQSVSGMPPFSVVVGNAHGARLVYEDKPVDLAPHTKIDVARLILQ